jgi:hypothetical protein
MCEGVFVAVEPITAAGLPSTFTSVLRLPSIVPVYGLGNGVGTGPPGVGTISMWTSVATTLSPCFAAGCPMTLA